MERETTDSGTPMGPRACAAPPFQEDDLAAGELQWSLAGPEQEDEWSRFVEARVDANLGHCFLWKSVVESAYGKRTFFLIARRAGTCCGVLPLVRMKGPLSGNRLVSLPFLDRAGVLATDRAAGDVLVAAALGINREVGARGVELRQSRDEDAADSARATLLLDLPGEADSLWKSFSPKVRNQVRKAEKEGLKTESFGPERLAAFYRVFGRNMRDLGSPVHSRRFLRTVLEAFGDRARLYLTEDSEGRIVGGAIALRFRDGVTVPWASSLREAFSMCPNHSLYWRILADSIAQGATVFDFGRSHLDSGTYRFKTQWGARPRPLTWSSIDATGRAEPTRSLKPGEHGRLIAIWSRLPVPLANLLGPVLRRQLSN